MTLTEIFVDRKPAQPVDLLDAWRDICEICLPPDDLSLMRIRKIHMHLREVLVPPTGGNHEVNPNAMATSAGGVASSP